MKTFDDDDPDWQTERESWNSMRRTEAAAETKLT
jgi:hypothetical protein